MKFAPMAIPAMALLQQHDSRRHILRSSSRRQRCADSKMLRPHRSTDPDHRSGNWGHSELGAQSGRKNPRACLFTSDLILSQQNSTTHTYVIVVITVNKHTMCLVKTHTVLHKQITTNVVSSLIIFYTLL